jgi:MoaA/NifB/PqqE/SkfB family radical SAM enzyme
MAGEKPVSGSELPAGPAICADPGENRAGALLPLGSPLAFHLLAKPTGAICNLDCTYCFFLSKEMLYPGSRFRMADDLLELYLRQLVEAHAASPEVVVAWQGGEPTMMGLDFFRRSVQLADWSTPAICTRVTTSWSPPASSATSAKRR